MKRKFLVGMARCNGVAKAHQPPMILSMLYVYIAFTKIKNKDSITLQNVKLNDRRAKILMCGAGVRPTEVATRVFKLKPGEKIWLKVIVKDKCGII